MPSLTLFPFSDYWWFYALFTLLVLGLLALDLGIFHRRAQAVTTRQAALWTTVWVSLALLFCFAFWQYAEWKLPQDARLIAAGVTPEMGHAFARQSALEFLTGYVVEASLSIDNIFVFLVVFAFFAIPPAYQHRVLFFGILGALIFRVVFISLGAFLMRFHWVIWVFGGFLIVTGLKILFAPEKPLDPEKNPVLRLLRRYLRVTPKLHGQEFFVVENGVRYGTPLLVALIAIECSDIVFAVDSVPAIFAITREPLIVFTSNIFAILGLRALFFLLAGIMEKFHFLKYGLGLVLIFVGLKMVWLDHAFGGKFPITWSLGIIGVLLGASIALSLLRPARPVLPEPSRAPR
ncbi:MAG: TerC/Alx family metal homeostasis membrane protein [Opitutaceae bacterium]|nr:TerC/Alx family metal homeostasis membrane protein [Opitutaceae bacterium]